MPILTMDSEAVQSLVNAMTTTAQEIQTQVGTIQSTANSMDWTSGGRQMFDDDLLNACRSMQNGSEQLNNFSERVYRAAQNWESIAQTYSIATSSANGGGGGGGGGGAGGNDDPISDPANKLDGAPSMEDVTSAVMDTLELLLGKQLANTLAGTVLDVSGAIMDAIQVIVNMPQYLQLQQQLNTASPDQTEAIQDQMYSIELDVLLQGWAALPIKASGKWQEAVDLWQKIRTGQSIVGKVQ